ncbi:MAG TPA: hypothetical protein ENN33_00880 [Ignavibacteria bacterium]|nr:hypothetical protein [Ignavibacteria bacterium]
MNKYFIEPDLEKSIYTLNDDIINTDFGRFVSLAERNDRKEENIDKPFWRIMPVTVEIFVREYMRSVEPSPEQWEVIKGVFPEIPTKEGWFFGVEEIILRIGQGGGKNTVMLIVCNYAFYLWCCLEDPHEYFNLQKDEDFDVLIYSQVNLLQARRVFFGRLTRVMINTIDPETGHNWYSQNIGLKIREYGQKDVKTESINIPHRNKIYGGISIYVMDTSAKSVEGYAIWMRITDEPSRANTPIKYATAKHQYETANGNQNTRFNIGFKLGMMFAYPEQEVNDLLIEQYQNHVKKGRANTIEINDHILVAWFYAHVFNPKLSEADYQKALNKPGADVIDINRRWKAEVPPNRFGFFMPYMEKIHECANPKLINPVKYKSILTERKVTVRGVDDIRKFTAIEIIETLRDDRRRYWGMDTSETGDSFIIVGGYPDVLDHEVTTLELEHYKSDGNKVIEKIAFNCKPVIDIIIKYIPSKEFPVDYVNVENNLVKLLGSEYKGSRGIRSDKYQSESLKQKMLDIGIRGAEATFFSNPVQVRMGKIVRHLVWNNAIEYLDDATLIREMTMLLMINNNKIDHPDGESKDIYDSMANCVCQIIESGINMIALDIDGIFDGESEVDEDRKRMEMYRTGIKRFQEKYNRIYNNDKEFCDFMREIGYKFEEYDVQICEMEMEYIDAKIADNKIGGGYGNLGGNLDIGDDMNFGSGQF